MAHGRHRFSPEQNRGQHAGSGDAIGLGSRALSRSLHEDAAQHESNQWREIGEQINNELDQASYLKELFESGLYRLVEQGSYHPRVLNRLTAVHMIPIIDGQQNDPYLKIANGYAKVGRRTGKFEDTEGRYIALRNIYSPAIAIHEIAHVSFQIGDQRVPNLLSEPIVNQAARQIMNANNVDSSKLDALYQPHERILNRIMQASGLTNWDISYITSGDDPFENERLLSHAVESRVGWDVVSYAQNLYVENITSASNPKRNLYTAANFVEHELKYYLPLPYEQTPVGA